MMQTRVMMACCVWLVGCGELPAPERPDPSEFVPPEDTPDPGIGVGEGQPPPTPFLNSMPSFTGYLVVPLSGETDPFSVVVVEGGAGTHFDEADSNGFFCVDVELRAERTQTLSVYAQDAEGRVSGTAEVEITHDPSLKPNQNPEPASSTLESVVAAGSTLVYADAIPTGGSLAYLVDNDPSTHLEIDAARVAIDLGAVFEVIELEVVFRDSFGEGEGEFATEYVLSTSDLDQPSAPSVWQPYRSIDGMGGGIGDGGSDRFELDPPRELRWLLVDLIENARGTDFFSEPFALSDVRVMARIEATPDPDPQPDAPRCAGSL